MSCKANPPLLVFFFCNFCLQLIFPSRGSFQAELIFVTNITNYICGEKIVMWKNLGKFWEFWRHFGKFWEILRNFGKFWEICHNLRAFMWRKIERKKYICGEKNDKYEVCFQVAPPPRFHAYTPPRESRAPLVRRFAKLFPRSLYNNQPAIRFSPSLLNCMHARSFDRVSIFPRR